MFKSRDKIYFLYIFVDVFIIFFSFLAAILIKFYNILQSEINILSFPSIREYIFIFAFWGILIIWLFKKNNLYSTDRIVTIPEEILLILRSLVFAAFAAGSVIFYLQFKFFSRFVFVVSFIILFSIFAFWRAIKRSVLRYLISRGFNNFNVVIIGAGQFAESVIEEIQARPFLGIQVKGVLKYPFEKSSVKAPVLGNPEDIEEVCKRFFIDEIIVTWPVSNDYMDKICRLSGKLRVGLRVAFPDFNSAMPVLNSHSLGHSTFITYTERKIDYVGLALKRLLDIFGSLAILFFLSPIFAILGFLIKIDSPGPVFYTQKRIGEKGRMFKFYKFRSMIMNSEEIKPDLLAKNEVKDGIIFKIREDPRVTGVGRILRRYSIDELPQLINVIKGDMSLVGPRPFPVDESNRIGYKHIPRLNIKPGVTGLAQIKGRSDLTFKQWMRWDIWYLNNWSLGLDIKILFWTMPVILKGKGAY